MKQGINVLSTFNGMGCIWYALEKCGIKVNKRYSSEIDKYAIQANDAAYPDTEQLGCIIKLTRAYTWREEIYNKALSSSYISQKTKDILIKNRKLINERIDFFAGGSPCQGFSFAGKQLNFNDPRSKLFFEFVKLWNKIKERNPKAKFLLENVNMKKEYLRVISEYMGVFPVRINSNLVSAQNRDRWYWTNIRVRKEGLFGELHSDIPQPKDKGIMLKDILQPEDEVDEKYYIKNPKFGFEGMDLNKKSNTLRTGGSCTQSNKHNYDIIKAYVNDKGVPREVFKSSCIDANYFKGIDNHAARTFVCAKVIGCVKFGRNEKAKEIRRKNAKQGKKDYNPFSEKEIIGIDVDKMNAITCTKNRDNLIFIGGFKDGKFSTEGSSRDFSQGARVYSTDGKSSTISAEGGGMGGKTGLYLIQKPRGFNKGGTHDEKCPSITSNSWDQNNVLNQNYKLRRLTPRECGRLQTFTDEQLDVLLNAGISDTQLYKMFGNGWTNDVIAHILSFMK